jgi:hypothetical protein
MEKNFADTKHSDLLKEFISFFIKEYGEIKVKEISKKVHSSKKVQKFLIEVRQLNTQLGTDDFLGTIHSLIQFTFAKPETISLATIILLSKWENEVGTPLGIADNKYLNLMFVRILDKCDKFKINLSDKPNFFKNFYDNFENTQKNKEKHFKEIKSKNNPKLWIKAALDSVEIYDEDFNNNYQEFSEFTFAAFILNCGLIYLWKFPEEVHQIGWDYTNEDKNTFVDLVLQKAKEYDNDSISTHENAEYFDENDRMENCLKFIAQYIDNFKNHQNFEDLNTISYNIYDEPMIIDFTHNQHEIRSESIELFNNLIKVLERIKRINL